MKLECIIRIDSNEHDKTGKNGMNVEHRDESHKHRKIFLINSSKKVTGTKTRAK